MQSNLDQPSRTQTVQAKCLKKVNQTNIHQVKLKSSRQLKIEIDKQSKTSTNLIKPPSTKCSKHTQKQRQVKYNQPNQGTHTLVKPPAPPNQQNPNKTTHI